MAVCIAVKLPDRRRVEAEQLRNAHDVQPVALEPLQQAPHRNEGPRVDVVQKHDRAGRDRGFNRANNGLRVCAREGVARVDAPAHVEHSKPGDQTIEARRRQPVRRTEEKDSVSRSGLDRPSAGDDLPSRGVVAKPRQSRVRPGVIADASQPRLIRGSAGRVGKPRADQEEGCARAPALEQPEKRERVGAWTVVEGQRDIGQASPAAEDGQPERRQPFDRPLLRGSTRGRAQ
jgi:hypothetical protein